MSATTQNTLAVLSCTAQAISFWDIETGERTHALNGLLAEPHELAFDQKRDVLYASHTYRGGMYGFDEGFSKEISIIDAKGKRLVDLIDVSPAGAPHGLSINEERDTLWVSVESLGNGEKGGLLEIDLKTRKILQSISCESALHWFSITPSFSKAYTCNKRDPFISVLDLKAGKMIKKVEVPEGSEEGCMSLSGSHVFFPTPGMKYGDVPNKGAVVVIDTKTDQIVKTVPTKDGYGPISVHVVQGGDIIVAEYRFGPRGPNGEPNPVPGVLEKFNSEWVKVGELNVGGMPLTMRSSADGKLGFLANCRDGTVTVFDIKSMKEIRTLDVDSKGNEANKFIPMSHGLALIP